MTEKESQQPFEQDPISPDLEQARKEQPSDLENTTTSIAESGSPSTTAVDGELEVSEQVYITGVKLVVVTASVTLVSFLILLDTSIISTAIPRITSEFHSLDDVAWYGSAYLLTNAVLQPLTGKLFSLLSNKKTFIFFVVLFELGSALCGAAQSSNMLIVGRAVAGLGGSGVRSGTLTIISASAPMHKRPALLGIMMGVTQIGVICGPLLGGVLTQYASWRWCFYINLPLGAIAVAFIVLIKIPENSFKNTEDKRTITSILQKLDLTGFFIFAPFAIQFLLALEWGGATYPWNSAKIIGLFCGSGGTLAVFLAWEYRTGDKAMIPFSIVRKRVVWSASSTSTFLFGSMMILIYYLPIYFQAVKGVSPALSGVYILPTILPQMVASVGSGILVGKWGYYLPWSVGCSVLTSVGAGLLSILTPSSGTGKWVGFQILIGFGRGCGLQMPFVAVQNNLTPQESPVGMAFLLFIQTFSGALFLSFAETIFSNSLVSGLAEFAPTVDAEAVIAAGASSFRSILQPGQLEGVLLAYNLSLVRCFYLAAATAAAVFVTCWGMGWKDVRKFKRISAAAKG